MTMTWSGFPGSPGYTNLHLQNPEEEPTLAVRDAAATRIRTFFQGFINYIPAGITITYPSVMEVFDTEQGHLVNELPITGLSPTACGGSGNWSSAVGACVNWGTSLVVNGRRLRGRTFMVPLASSTFDTSGTLSNSVRDSMLGHANTLIAPVNDLPLAVWHKPSPAVEGYSSQVSSASIADKTAVLRSRRD